MDLDYLRRMIAEDEFGLLKVVEKTPPMGPEERLVAAYQEIAAFVAAYGREPKVNPHDVAESKLAMRLRAMAGNEAQRMLLKPYDELGLLQEPEPPASIEEALADDSIGLLDDDADIFRLEHVPKTRTSPEQMARRKPCPDFDKFEALFFGCHADLRKGDRKLLPFKNPQQITEGSFFVLNGVLVYIAHIGERIQDATGDSNARMRCIFENATESDLLLRSLASQLYKDGKRVTEPEARVAQPIELDPRTPMGVVYVLRSLSDDPQVRSIPNLHKIGCTVRTTKQRTRDAVKEATYLMEPIEIVDEYLVPAGSEAKYEHLLHLLFTAVRLDVAFEREGVATVEAHEWFSVPTEVINEAMELIASETIVNYEYDPDQQRLKLRS
jgi:hypothetical protein